ncbi:NUDIX hydrolase [Marmoricola sp. RAF53]|uniref:NUDIX hydrolase n=1 Tax=Marmoricola sp. RAF53 TaxID=3233059 RepID=UPI003F97D617
MAPTDSPADPAPGSDIVAAGAVVLRRRNGGEVLLVHRPKYDDWAWPKGKRDPGEHVAAAAVREVLEETGVEIRLGRPLPPQLYTVASGRTKIVHYWTGHPVGSKRVSWYAANDEIDQVGWFGLEKARRLLTYTDDIDLLDRVARHPRRTRALVVVRHARARKRASWAGPDSERGLTAVGQVQARSLAPVLSAYGVSRVMTSDSTRCLRTVAPYAADHVLPIEAVPGLNEEEASPLSVRQAVQELIASKENAVLCTHRPVLPEVFAELGIEEEPLAQGELVVCHHRQGRVVATERHLVR